MGTHLKMALVTVLSFLFYTGGFTQGSLQTNCVNSNFNEGTFYKWEGCYGGYNNPCQSPGFFQVPPNERHKIITGPGEADPNTTCSPPDKLINVFPGEAYSARLGNDNNGAQAEQLSYTVTVGANNYLFIYRYAVILEDNNHPENQQPKFIIEIKDAGTGLVIDSTCGYYYVYAQPGLPGWRACGTAGVPIHWKEWTTVGMDLTPYADNTINIVFTTKDCSPGGHFGYAYISAYCSSLDIQIGLCSGDTAAILTAPPGFANYQWRGPGYSGPVIGTGQSVTINNPVANDMYYCNLTAINGCVVNDLSQKISYTSIDAQFNYTVNCAARPSNFQDQTTITQNQVVDWHWDFDDGSPLVTGVQHPTHTFALPGTYNVKLKSFSTEGCKDSVIHAVTIPPLPAFSNTPAIQTQCNNQSTNITLVPNVPGATFTWRAIPKTANISGGTNGTVPGTIISNVLINSGTTVDTMIYRTVGHAAGLCTGDSIDFKVAVYPTPTLGNSPLNKSICDSTSTSLNLTGPVAGTTFNWICTPGSANITGYSANTGAPSTVINQVLDNTGFSTESVIYRIAPIANGCAGDSALYTVFVKPSPDLSNTPLRKEMCDSSMTNIALNSHVPATSFTWTCTAPPSISGWANSATPGVLIDQRLLNTTFVIDSMLYHITPHADGCTGHIFNYRVVVKPLPDVIISPSSEICSEQITNIPLSSGMPGTTFTWPSPVCTNILTIPPPGSGNVITNQLEVQIPSLDGTVVYTVTPHNNGCSGNNPKTHTVTVRQFPVPVINGTNSLCEGSSGIIYSTTSGMNGYTWNISPGGTITGGSGTNAVTISWTTAGNGTERWISVNYTNNYGCTAENPTLFYVTVKPLPNVIATPLSQDVCNGEMALIQFESSVPGTTANTLFNWSLTAGPAVSPPNLTGNGNVSQSFITTSSVYEPVVFTIMPVADGCSAPAPFTCHVNVKPVPNFTSPAIAPVCSGSFTNVPLTSDVSGTLFTWTSSVITGSATGNSASSVPGTLLNDLLINTGNTDAVIRYQIVPHANGCDGTVYSYDITVHPVAQLTNDPKTKEICQGNFTNLNLLSNVAGTAFTWTCTQTSGNVSGWSNSAAPALLINQFLNLSVFVLDSVIYHITPNANGCAGTQANYKVIVNPVPKVTNTPMHDSICSATDPGINLTATCAGTTFTWSGAPGTGTISGFGSGSTPVIAETLVNEGFTTGSVLYTVTPKAGNCTGRDTLYTVYVYPKPNLTTLPLSSSQCSGVITNIPLTSDVAGTQHAWTASASAPAISGYSGGFGTLISQTLVNSGTTPETVTYSITPRANGCDGDTYHYTVTVFPVPHLTNTPPETICSGTLLNIPLLSDVSGASFTWTATCLPSGAVTGFTASQVAPVTSINDQPVNSANEIATVTYTVVPQANGCSGSGTFLMQPVNPVPQISCASSQSICSGTETSEVTLHSTVAGTDFSWSASCPAGSINPCPLPSGFSNPIPPVTLINTTDIQQFVTYSITSSFDQCPGSAASHTITVNPSPSVTNWPLSQTLCSGNTSTPVQLTSPVSGTTFSWTAAANGPVTGFSTSGSDEIPPQTLFIPPGSAGFVTYHIIPSFTGGTTCPGTPTDYIIHVNPLPTPVISGQTPVCELQPAMVYSTPAVPGHSYAWTITGATAVAGQSTATVTLTWGDYTLSPGTLSVTETIDATGCMQPTPAYPVMILQRPIPTLTGPQSVCDRSVGKVYLTEAGMSDYTWAVQGGVITAGGSNASPSATVSWNSPGPRSVEVNYINTMGCPGFPSMVLPVTVHPLPDVTVVEGPGPNCEGASHTYDVPPDPACTYLWSITPVQLGFVSGGQGTATVTIDWLNMGTASLSVTATNSNTACIATGNHSVAVHPRPEPSFTVPCFDLITTPAARPIVLRGATPKIHGQGSYAGNRVSYNAVSGRYEFNPFGAPVGNYQVTYSFINNYGCTATTSPVTISIVNTFFSCGGTLTDVRDGKTYSTITLAGKCWMRTNLGFGNTLSSPGPAQTDNCLPEKYCLPSDPGCTLYGGHYQWDELMEYMDQPGLKGICPPEWHVPTDAEWQSLIDNVLTGVGAPDANALAGSILKDQTVTGGFYALLGGINYANNAWAFFSGSHTATMFWTSTPYDGLRAVARGLNIFTPSVSRYHNSRGNAFPLRCVKD